MYIRGPKDRGSQVAAGSIVLYSELFDYAFKLCIYIYIYICVYVRIYIYIYI